MSDSEHFLWRGPCPNCGSYNVFSTLFCTKCDTAIGDLDGKTTQELFEEWEEEANEIDFP